MTTRSAKEIINKLLNLYKNIFRRLENPYFGLLICVHVGDNIVEFCEHSRQFCYKTEKHKFCGRVSKNRPVLHQNISVLSFIRLYIFENGMYFRVIFNLRF